MGCVVVGEVNGDGEELILVVGVCEEELGLYVFVSSPTGKEIRNNDGVLVKEAGVKGL